MLIDAKPKLEKDIELILQTALFNAFMTTMNKESEADPIIKARLTQELTKAGTDFANMAAKTASKPLAQAIYEFVLKIGIIATPKALMSPHGPCTGSIVEKEFKIL